METRYVTVTVRTTNQIEQEQRPVHRAKKKQSSLSLFLLAMAIMLGLFVGVTQIVPDVRVYSQEPETVMVDNGLTNGVVQDKVSQRYTSEQVKTLTTLAEKHACSPKGELLKPVVVEEPEVMEPALEVSKPGDILNVIEVSPTPTIEPLSTRESYALRYFEEHDEGTDEHLDELGEFTLTFYCTCKKCCGKDPSNPAYGITCSGTHVQEGRTIAVDPKVIPLGQEVYIEGFGTFTAEDTGSGVGNKHIDVYVSDHQVAINCGVAKAQVYA